MQIKPGDFCPLLKKDCVGIKCSWFTQVRGTNPNTGQEIDEWNCAITWLPVLLIENSQQQRQTGAAVESFRNEMVKANEVGQQILLETVSKSPRISYEEE
jgi:hypothetical protein